MPKPINSDNTIKGKIINNTQTIKGKINQDITVIKGLVATTATDASTTKKGVIRIATDDEVLKGELSNVAITPRTLKLATNFVYEQSEASNEWIITHNLNKKPSITITDTAGTVIEGVETYIDNNTIKIEFNHKFKGKAVLN